MVVVGAHGHDVLDGASDGLERVPCRGGRVATVVLQPGEPFVGHDDRVLAARGD